MYLSPIHVSPVSPRSPGWKCPAVRPPTHLLRPKIEPRLCGMQNGHVCRAKQCHSARLGPLKLAAGEGAKTLSVTES